MRRRGTVSRYLRGFLLIGAMAAFTSCDAPTPGPTRSEEPPSLERLDTVRPPPSAGRREVVYTIVRGGTLKNVANLYKLYHHEIFALNPAMDPEQELQPETDVVVHRDLGGPSESVGLPHDGRVVGSMPMPDGPGRKITAERWKTWGTRSTIQQLDRLLKRWSELMPNGPPVLVGNLSARKGGPLAPHKTHQSGRDVDLSYIAHWNGRDRVTWQHMSADTLDSAATWKLLKLLVREADIEVIFVDRVLQRALLRHAEKHRTIRASRLSKWLEVADGGDQRSLVRHVPGHKDHMHVRFACPPSDRRCRS